MQQSAVTNAGSEVTDMPGWAQVLDDCYKMYTILFLLPLLLLHHHSSDTHDIKCIETVASHSIIVQSKPSSMSTTAITCITGIETMHSANNTEPRGKEEMHVQVDALASMIDSLTCTSL